jgi:hypothetical protein
MVGFHPDVDDGHMNRSPSFIASVCFVAAALAMGPFGPAGGSATKDTGAISCGEAPTTAPSTPVATPCRP